MDCDGLCAVGTVVSFLFPRFEGCCACWFCLFFLSFFGAFLALSGA